MKEDYLLNKNIINVIHVGANIGQELPQYHKMGVKKVVWIEAHPDIYQELLNNLKLMQINDIESLAFNNLISDVDDRETDFHIYIGEGNNGMSSILKGRNDTLLHYRGTIRQKSLTLDTFLERNNLGYEFDLLYMDTQGSELMIAKGASKVLRNVKYINSEVSFSNPGYENNPLFDEINEYFSSFGFRHVETQVLSPYFGDAIFERSNKS